MNLKNNTLHLLINEESISCLNHEQILYEAALLGIDNVVFVYENNVNRRVNSKLIRLKAICKIFKLNVLKDGLCVCNNGDFYPDLVPADENGVLLPSLDRVGFEEYKNEEINRKKLLKNRVFQKFINMNNN